MCQTNAIEDKNYQTSLQSGLGEVGSSKRLDCKEERTGKPTPPAPAKVSTEAKQAIPAPAVVRPAPRPKSGTSLCAPGSRKPDCRACKEDNKCQPAKFPSAETPKTPEVGKKCPEYATKGQIKAKIAARKGLRDRSNVLKNEKLRKFEYFRGINETPLQPHPQKRQDSGAGGTKRKLFTSPVSTDSIGGETAAPADPSSPTKKTKTQKSEKILKILHAESYQTVPIKRVSTDETQHAGVTSEDYKQACEGVYLGGTYPYGEFHVDETSLRDAVNDDDSDATLPYEAEESRTCVFPGFGGSKIKEEKCWHCETVCITRVSRTWRNAGCEFFFCPNDGCYKDFVKWSHSKKERELLQAKMNEMAHCLRCGGPSTKKISRSKNNPGREYNACANKDCDERFISWAATVIKDKEEECDFDRQWKNC